MAKQPMRKYGFDDQHPVQPRRSSGPGQGPSRFSVLREELGGWRITDLIGYAGAWIAGTLLAAIAFFLLAFLAVKASATCRSTSSRTGPSRATDQSQTGGILDPMIGTVLMVVIGTAWALPLGVGAALWVVEYGKGSRLARAVESAIEVVAGMPSIVIAIFGLAIAQTHLMAPFSITAQGGAVFGRSFVIAGSAMSLIALPLVFSATREGTPHRAEPRARGELRPRQDAGGDDPPRAPAVGALEHRHRHGARHGPDRGRHRDHRDPARRDAAHPARGERPAAARPPARHRLDAHQLRLQQLPCR